jgi:hypothetical protein
MSKSIRTNCNSCSKQTNHQLLFVKKVVTREDYEVLEVDVKEKIIEEFMTIQCKGCDEVSFLHRLSGDLFVDSEGKKQFLEFNYPEEEYPSEFDTLKDQQVLQLPSVLKNVYQEIVTALDSGANLLAGVGLRILVEAICMEQNISGSNLKEKIIELEKRGLISKNEVPILDKLREIGNTAAHRIKAFPSDKLSYALNIINHALTNIYILPKISEKLTLQAKPRIKKFK